MGYNSGSGLAVGTALEDFDVEVNEYAAAQKVFASISIVNSHEELLDALGMSFEAQGRYGFFQASAKADFSESTQFNSTSTFIVAKCIVRNPFLRGTNFKVSKTAQNLLDTNRFDEFTTAFGDSFVRGQQTGGEFYTVIRITSVSVQTQTDLALSLQAEYNGLAVAGEFKGKFATASSSSSTRSEFQATMYQEAGSGPTVAPITSVEELIPRFRDFPTIALASSAAYETEVATYDTLPLPLPTPEDQENFEFALRDTRDQKLHFTQVRNDLTFALRNPHFFDQLPSVAVLQDAIAGYTKLLNACINHASRLAQGQMKPAQTFDPSALTPPLAEPAPITLVRAPSGAVASVPVPSLLDLDYWRIDYAMRCLELGTVEQALAGTVLTGEDDQPAPIEVSHEVAVFLKTCMAVGVGFDFELPPSVFPASVFSVQAQFPAAGAVIAPPAKLILQFAEHEVV
ncbi:hypothetical protein [Cellulomonas sp. ICMP 17802]|uniref:hypothetical protein n=1 Tax=Cellulomonas sp. ICMP 17802 TaxID=3239199 RepID=UPI00351AF73B